MKRSRNAFVSCRLCVCCVIARVRCLVLQWKHPGPQLAGSRFEPRCRSHRSSGAAARAKERAGRQPPVTRERWRGALLQVAGHIFSYTACVHMVSFAACVRMFSFATCVARRSCSTDPVGNAAALQGEKGVNRAPLASTPPHPKTGYVDGTPKSYQA